MSIIKKIQFYYRNLFFALFYKRLFSKFNFYIVTDEKEKEEIYRLRYKVYCEEYGYIDKTLFPKGLEKDEYDQYSDFLVIRDQKKEIAATVRIIYRSRLPFPIEKHFKFNIDLSGIDNNRIVEISRLIVARQYRKKHLLIFILKGLSVLAINKNISHAFCVIDEKLYPLLKKISVPARIIGDKAAYQGITFPCLILISEWMEEVRKNKVINSFFTYKGFTFDDSNGKYVIH